MLAPSVEIIEPNVDLGVENHALGLREARPFIAGIASATTLAAVVGDPDGARALLLLIPLAALAAWTWRPAVPVAVLSAAVMVPVFLAQLDGRLEPSMFLVALLVFAVAGWDDSRRGPAIVCGLALATPIALFAAQPADNRISWVIWTIGLGFTAVIGRSLHRQRQLTATLAEARGRLERHAQAEERRRIARDVHDLVGHGLATVLMQVAGARHVLERDPEAAAEALAAAQTTGRRSMRDLRGTLALLRDDEQDAEDRHGPPDLGQLESLVAATRDQGVAVELKVTGDLGAIDPVSSLALFRIAQEALHNVARHAPRALTVVGLTVVADRAYMSVDSRGPLLEPTEPGRPRFGLIGMRERALAVGGELDAERRVDGWTVSCQVPIGDR